MYASLAITSLMWSLDLSQRGDSLTMSAATSYLIRYSLEPLAPARSSISLSESLSPSRRRWPRPSCDCLYASRLVEDLLDRLQVVRVSGSLSSLRGAAIADRSPASRPVLFCKSPGPLLHTLLRSALSREHDGHRMPSLSAPPRNMLSPSAPDMPPAPHIPTWNSPRLMAAPSLCDIFSVSFSS